MAKKATQKATTKEANKPEQQTKKTNTMEIEVRIDRLINKPDSNVKAIASVNLGGGFAVHGFKITNSEKGLFVSMPSTSYTKNGQTQYNDTFHPVTAEAREELLSKMYEAYDQAVANLHGTKQAETAEENQDAMEEEAEEEVPKAGPVM